MKHRSAPDHRRIPFGQETHRDQLDAVLLRRHDLLAVGLQLRVDAEHDRHVRAVDVPVDHRHARPRLAERDRQVDGHRGLADASLAGADGDNILHPLDRRLVHFRGDRRPHMSGHVHLHGGDARYPRHQIARQRSHVFLRRGGRRGELDGERHASVLDPQVLDELQRDDVAVEVGIADRAEHLQHRRFRDAVHNLQLYFRDAGRTCLVDVALGNLAHQRQLVPLAAVGLVHQEEPEPDRKPGNDPETDQPAEEGDGCGDDDPGDRQAAESQQ